MEHESAGISLSPLAVLPASSTKSAVSVFLLFVALIFSSLLALFAFCSSPQRASSLSPLHLQLRPSGVVLIAQSFVFLCIGMFLNRLQLTFSSSFLSVYRHSP